MALNPAPLTQTEPESVHTLVNFVSEESDAYTLLLLLGDQRNRRSEKRPCRNQKLPASDLAHRLSRTRLQESLRLSDRIGSEAVIPVCILSATRDVAKLVRQFGDHDWLRDLELKGRLSVFVGVVLGSTGEIDVFAVNMQGDGYPIGFIPYTVDRARRHGENIIGAEYFSSDPF